MAGKKNNFLMRLEWSPVFLTLSDEDAGQLIKSVYSYLTTGETVVENTMLSAFFEMIKLTLDENKNKYEDACKKKSENAKKRWNAAAVSEMQEYASACNSTQEHTAVGDMICNDMICNDMSDMNNIYSSSGEDDSVNYQEIIDLYHSICFDLSRVKTISEPRKKAMRNRIKEFGIDGVEEVFHKVHASDFLCGRKNGSWKCNFDWIMKPANFIKVREDAYEYSNNTGTSQYFSDTQF